MAAAEAEAANHGYVHVAELVADVELDLLELFFVLLVLLVLDEVEGTDVLGLEQLRVDLQHEVPNDDDEDLGYATDV